MAEAGHPYSYSEQYRASASFQQKKTKLNCHTFRPDRSGSDDAITEIITYAMPLFNLTALCANRDLK